MIDIKHTPGPWEYVPSTENHGPYVAGPHGGDVCDCYAMTDPTAPSVRNGGPSKPVPFCGEQADANARLIAAAPELLEALKECREACMYGDEPDGTRVSDDDAISPALFDRICAAIAKAEGKS